MDNKKFWIILLTSVILAFIIAFILFWIFVDVHEYDMHLKVGSRTGINIDTDAIYFGTIKPGDGVTKKIMITNSGSARKVALKTTGELNQWIHYESSQEIGANEKKDISLTVNVPKDADLGEYKGKLRVYVYG